jgi:hypothetical protein
MRTPGSCFGLRKAWNNCVELVYNAVRPVLPVHAHSIATEIDQKK